MQIQIQLTQDEVEDILKAHIQENLGVDLRNRQVTITFSGARSDRKVGAEITVEMDSLVPLKPVVTESSPQFTEVDEPTPTTKKPAAEAFKQATEEAKAVVPSKGKLNVPEEPGDVLAEEEDAPFEPDEPKPEPDPKPTKKKGSLFGD